MAKLTQIHGHDLREQVPGHHLVSNLALLNDLDNLLGLPVAVDSVAVVACPWDQEGEVAVDIMDLRVRFELPVRQ